jgi:hypothetical protein
VLVGFFGPGQGVHLGKEATAFGDSIFVMLVLGSHIDLDQLENEAAL